MARVQLKNVEKTFNKNKVLKGINVEVPDGSFMVMVGPSGCGKSMALRCIAGLEEVTGGSIFIGDEDVTSKEPKDRNIAMVFQNYALYPHMNVFDNITYGLKVRGIPADERKRRAEDAAKLLGLDGLLDRPNSFPAASASVWPWAGPSCASPACSSSTNRFPTSTPTSATRCASSCAVCTSVWRPPAST